MSVATIRIVVIGLALAGCWSSPPPPQAPLAAPIARAPRPPALRAPLNAEIGTVDDARGFQPTTEIPLFAGSTFAWRIELGCERTVMVEEQLELPSRGDWGSDPEMFVSKDGRVARVSSDAICLDGWIDKTWTVSAADPPGQWKLTVTVDGFRPQVFYPRFVSGSAPPISPLPQPVPGPFPAPTP